MGDVSKDPRYLNAVEAVRSELAVPLVVRGRVIGVMDIESRELDYFSPSQQNILTLVAEPHQPGHPQRAPARQLLRKQAQTLLLLNEMGREAEFYAASRRRPSAALRN